MKEADRPDVAKTSLTLRPVPAALLLVSAGVGAVVLVGFVTLTLVPVVLVTGLIAALILGAVACGWAGIEALAALERWLERDSRFQR